MTHGGAAEAVFFGAVAKQLSMTPTEYFRRNVWVGASFLRPSEAPLRHDVGVDRIMWGADYPHSEGSYPYTTEALRAAFGDVPLDETRRMVETNAARRVRLRPRRAARRSATAIGPTVAEVASPARPGRLPDRLHLQRVRPGPGRQGLVNRTREGAPMTVRYGPRDPDRQRNREVEATAAKIWSTAVTVVWETDPDVIRAVLPPPLEPSEPLARIRFATVDMGTGIPVVRRRAGSACAPATPGPRASTRCSCR